MACRVKGPRDVGLAHVRVNGYANAWRLPWRGTYDVTITYGPERLARLAQRIDLVLIPLVLVMWLGSAAVAWRRRTPPS